MPQSNADEFQAIAAAGGDRKAQRIKDIQAAALAQQLQNQQAINMGQNAYGMQLAQMQGQNAAAIAAAHDKANLDHYDMMYGQRGAWDRRNETLANAKTDSADIYAQGRVDASQVAADARMATSGRRRGSVGGAPSASSGGSSGDGGGDYNPMLDPKILANLTAPGGALSNPSDLENYITKHTSKTPTTGADALNYQGGNANQNPNQAGQQQAPDRNQIVDQAFNDYAKSKGFSSQGGNNPMTYQGQVGGMQGDQIGKFIRSDGTPFFANAAAALNAPRPQQQAQSNYANNIPATVTPDQQQKRSGPGQPVLLPSHGGVPGGGMPMTPGLPQAQASPPPYDAMANYLSDRIANAQNNMANMSGNYPQPAQPITGIGPDYDIAHPPMSIWDRYHSYLNSVQNKMSTGPDLSYRPYQSSIAYQNAQPGKLFRRKSWNAQ